MRNHLKIASIFLGVLLLSAASSRSDDDDLERLRDAVSRGEVMPLSVLQQKLQKTWPGEIIKVELEEDDGRFIYEFRILRRDGRLFEIEVDARTGAVIDVDDDD